MVLVAIYIAWRLETKMAIAAIVAVIHDVIITMGVYSVFQIEVTPATVISFLTILGFSLYDTIVVYDRVQENATRLRPDRPVHLPGHHAPLARTRCSCGRSTRRWSPSCRSLSMLIVGQVVFGQKTLGDFSLALLIGLISGTYSSLFVAAPLTSWLKEREPRYVEIRKRLVATRCRRAATRRGTASPRRRRGLVPPRPSAQPTRRPPARPAGTDGGRRGHLDHDGHDAHGPRQGREPAPRRSVGTPRGRGRRRSAEPSAASPEASTACASR